MSGRSKTSKTKRSGSSTWMRMATLLLIAMSLLMATGCTEGEVWFWQTIHNDPWMSCVRDRESRGDYTINTGNGYAGAYQFLPSTWRSMANKYGNADLAATPVERVPWFFQDWIVYQMKMDGLQSQWGTNRMCGG